MLLIWLPGRFVAVLRGTCQETCVRLAVFKTDSSSCLPRTSVAEAVMTPHAMCSLKNEFKGPGHVVAILGFHNLCAAAGYMRHMLDASDSRQTTDFIWQSYELQVQIQNLQLFQPRWICQRVYHASMSAVLLGQHTAVAAWLTIDEG